MVYVCPDHQGYDLVVHNADQFSVEMICIKCKRRFMTYTEAGRAAQKAEEAKAAQPDIKDIKIVREFEMPTTGEVVFAIRDLLAAKGPLAEGTVIVLAVGLVPRLYILDTTTGAIIDHGDIEIR